jgi:uncharacterized protein
MVNLESPLMEEAEVVEINSTYQPSDIDIQELKDLYQGDYHGIRQVLVSNYTDVDELAPNRLLEAFSFSAILRAFSMMCLGMVLLKLGLLQGKFSDIFYRRLFLISLLISVPIISLGLIYNYWHNWQLESFAPYGSIANDIGSVPLIVAYIAIFSLFQRAGVFSRLKGAVQNVGQMALTNYLMQSVICSFVFYGYGLGLYAQLTRLQLLPIIILIGILQLSWSTWWLSHFKQGPIEWVWRVLTYLRWQSLFREKNKFL